MEQELKAAKRFNRAAMVMIVILLAAMGFMLADMRRWADRYESLEKKYEVLYEEIMESSIRALQNAA